jgi:hypothetical protein
MALALMACFSGSVHLEESMVSLRRRIRFATFRLEFSTERFLAKAISSFES